MSGLVTAAEAQELLDAMPEHTNFVNMAETIYEGLCAMIDHPEWEKRDGPFLIARLPEYEDGSDPRWKLLEHAPALARTVVAQSAELDQLRARAEAAEGALMPAEELNLAVAREVMGWTTKPVQKGFRPATRPSIARQVAMRVTRQMGLAHEVGVVRRGLSHLLLSPARTSLAALLVVRQKRAALAQAGEEEG